MKKIELKDIISVSKIENEYDYDIEIVVKNPVFPWMTNSVVFTKDALFEIKAEFEEISKNDFYSGAQHERVVKKFIDTPLP